MHLLHTLFALRHVTKLCFSFCTENAVLTFDTELISLQKKPFNFDIMATLQVLSVPALIIYVIYYLYDRYKKETSETKELKKSKKKK